MPSPPPTKLLFGTAGTPHTAKSRDTVSGVARVAELGLGCMEVEFVRGVRMGPETQALVAEAAHTSGVFLSAHGPYYINLNSDDKGKREASITRVLDTGRAGFGCSARTITFHAGTYMKMDPIKVHATMKKQLRRITSTLADEGVDVWVRPEVSGKASQYGSLEELISLSQDVEGLLPCVDFSHLHARTVGGYNTREELREAMVMMEDGLGRSWLDDAHIHLQGVEYGEKGERRHLDLADSDLNYREHLLVFREFGVKGVVICESPSLEDDALVLKRAYARVKA